MAAKVSTISTPEVAQLKVRIKGRLYTLSISVEEFTPQRAHECLERATINRSLSKSTVRLLATSIQRGQWLLGQAIYFDENDVPMDGHHRLRAVILAGEPCTFLVIRGFPRESFSVFDRTRPRKADSVLEILDQLADKDKKLPAARSRALANVARAVLAYEQGLVKHAGAAGGAGGGGNISAVVTQDDIIERAKGDALLQECVELCSSTYRVAGRLMRSSQMAGALLYFFSTVDSDQTKDFYTMLCGDMTTDVGNPAWQLKMKLQRHIGPDKLAPQQISGFSVKAWNMFYAGKRGQLRYNFGSEQIPKISGYTHKE